MITKSQCLTLIGFVVLSSIANADNSTPLTSTGAPVGASPLGTVPPVSVPSLSSALGVGASNLFQGCGGDDPSSDLAALIAKQKGGSSAAASAGSPAGGPSGTPGSSGLNCPNTCKPNAVAPDPSTFTCDALTTNGIFDQNKFNTDECNLQCAQKADTTKENSLTAIQSNLTCMQNSSAQLTAQMRATQTAFTQVLQAAQTATAALTTAEQGRDAQETQVKEKLNGGGTNGAEGLLKIQSETMTMAAAMPAEISAIQAQHHALDNATAQYQRGIQDETMADTVNCFNTDTSAGYSCYPGGPIVSIEAYIVCRVQENYQVTAGGQIQQDQTSIQQAQAVGSQLQNILDGITGQAPVATQPAANPTDAAADAAHPSQLLTVSDIETQYGASLSAIDTEFSQNNRLPLGQSVHDFVIAAYGYCYTKANQEVQNDMLNPNKPLYQQADTIKQQTTALEAQVDPLFLKYSSQLSTNLGALTGVAQSYDLASNCSDPTQEAQQMSCLTQMQTLLNGQLLGSASSPTLGMQLAGNQYVQPINVQCKGLNGCVTQLQTLDTQIKTDATAIHTSKQKIIQQVNQQIDTMTNQLAAAYSVPAQRLASQVNALESSLAALGVPPSITKTPVTPEALVKGQSTSTDANGNQVTEEGLYNVPKSAFNVLAGLTSPPLLDISGDVYSTTTAAIATARTNLDTAAQNLATAQTTLDGLATSCANQEREAAATDLNNDVKALDECQASTQVCLINQGNTLQSLTNTWAAIYNGNTGGIDPDTLSNLNGGMANICKGFGATPTTQTATQSDNGSVIVEQQAPVPQICSGVSLGISKDLGTLGALNGNPTSNSAH